VRGEEKDQKRYRPEKVPRPVVSCWSAKSCEARGRAGIISAKDVLIMATDTTNKSWVQKTAGVCGGRACIRTTRITVWGLVNSRRLGIGNDQILRNIVGLMPEDMEAAWDYYREHPAEIDEDIRANEVD
jgi:uncharacterized protein (DUF433 family)